MGAARSYPPMPWTSSSSPPTRRRSTTGSTTDFQEKQKASREKIAEAFKGQDKDKIREAVQGLRTDGEKLRTDYLAKVEPILTADQKKTFDEVKPSSRGGRLRRPGGAGAPARCSPPACRTGST